jgi:DNA-binding MarR family transcriptional regulator
MSTGARCCSVATELTRALSDYRMAPEQWHVLAVLEDASVPVPQSQVGYALLKDKPTITRILQRMERDGWVHRFEEAGNARVTLVEQTPAGRALCAKIPDLLTRQLAPVVGQLTPESHDRLIVDLRRLRTLMGDVE